MSHWTSDPAAIDQMIEQDETLDKLIQLEREIARWELMLKDEGQIYSLLCDPRSTVISADRQRAISKIIEFKRDTLKSM